MISHRGFIRLLAAALLLLCGCSSSLRTRPDITVPPVTTAAYTETPATDILLTDTAGNAVQLFDHLGKPVLLQFWPDSNAVSDEDLGAMQRAYADFGESIVFLLVCPAPPMPETALSDRGLTASLCFDPDGAAAAAYDASQTAATIFINADGFIVTQSIGPISEDALQFGLKLL